MKIYPCGTHVETVIGGVPGMITAVRIEFVAIIYIICYYHSDGFRTYEMSENKFIVTDKNKKQNIGFIKQQ